jgi:hypothetical protein
VRDLRTDRRAYLAERREARRDFRQDWRR